MSIYQDGMPPPDEDPGCCIGAAVVGACTCWRPLLDVTPEPPREGPMPIRRECCHDCAYRHDSPERAAGDDPDYTRSEAFACHEGMPRAVRYEHPCGAVREAEPGDYQPLIRGGRTFQADGHPALLCAGWAATNGLPRPKGRRP